MAADLGKVGIVMKGAWDSSVVYETLDAVTYNNGLYIAKQNVPANTTPADGVYWQLALSASAIVQQIPIYETFDLSDMTLEPNRVIDYLSSTSADGIVNGVMTDISGSISYSYIGSVFGGVTYGNFIIQEARYMEFVRFAWGTGWKCRLYTSP